MIIRDYLSESMERNSSEAKIFSNFQHITKSGFSMIFVLAVISPLPKDDEVHVLLSYFFKIQFNYSPSVPIFSDNNFTSISDLYLGCCIHYPGQYPSFKQQCVKKSINY